MRERISAITRKEASGFFLFSTGGEVDRCGSKINLSYGVLIYLRRIRSHICRNGRKSKEDQEDEREKKNVPEERRIEQCVPVPWFVLIPGLYKRRERQCKVLNTIEGLTESGIRGRLRDCSLFRLCAAIVRSILKRSVSRCLMCLDRKTRSSGLLRILVNEQVKARAASNPAEDLLKNWMRADRCLPIAIIVIVIST